MIDQLHAQLGDEKITRMVGAFYARVKDDDLIGPMYPDDDWEGAEKRLRDFLIYRFGGPDTYIRERGHPRLRGRHLPFKIGVAERDRWLDLMGQAMREAEVPVEVAPVLGAFFAQIADFMRNTEG
ncbi:globin [Phragmitibacter flavus]|uniref:Globin n=1 Tax=Phragmitibacter flavus TaxID=2576071 RepID=A0A5R8K824_9BACT|nr:globin [Phragmitibacter flavus]TLD68492.1 globin [Phragmitibacter flavus]